MYRLSGSACAARVTTTTLGGSEQHTVSLEPGWESETQVLPSGHPATLLAQQTAALPAANDYAPRRACGTELTCELVIDGVTARRSTSEGEGSVVTCRGLVP